MFAWSQPLKLNIPTDKWAHNDNKYSFWLNHVCTFIQEKQMTKKKYRRRNIIIATKTFKIYENFASELQYTVTFVEISVDLVRKNIIWARTFIKYVWQTRYITLITMRDLEKYYVSGYRGRRSTLRMIYFPDFYQLLKQGFNSHWFDVVLRLVTPRPGTKRVLL